MFGVNMGSRAEDKNYADMNVAQFAQLLNDKNVQLLDVRTPEEYAEGHIPGAINIDVFDKDFLAEATKSLDKARPVAVYCRSGKRSAEAARQLASQGYDVSNLLGGILAWKESFLR